MKYDKQNGDVAFIEETHKYVNVKYPQRNYISVTTLIARFHEPYDTDFWSSYKAMELLMGPEAFSASRIKGSLLDTKKFDLDVEMFGIPEEDFKIAKQSFVDKYTRANVEACERGTAYHKEKEQALYDQESCKLSSLPFSLPIPGDPEYIIMRDDCDLTRMHDLKTEFLLYWSDDDHIVNLAGQVDLIVKDGNDIYILDHKTNAKGIQMNSYFDRKRKKSVRMYYPLNHLDDCNVVHYTLQLSLYAWMLQQINPEFNIKVLRLLHVDGEGKNTEYDLEYRKDEVEAMLLTYRNKLIEQHFRETNKIPRLADKKRKP